MAAVISRCSRAQLHDWAAASRVAKGGGGGAYAAKDGFCASFRSNSQEAQEGAKEAGSESAARAREELHVFWLDWLHRVCCMHLSTITRVRLYRLLLLGPIRASHSSVVEFPVSILEIVPECYFCENSTNLLKWLLYFRDAIHNKVAFFFYC